MEGLNEDSQTSEAPSVASLMKERERLQALYSEGNAKLRQINSAPGRASGQLTLKGVVIRQMQDALDGMKIISDKIRALQPKK